MQKCGNMIIILRIVNKDTALNQKVQMMSIPNTCVESDACVYWGQNLAAFTQHSSIFSMKQFIKAEETNATDIWM